MTKYYGVIFEHQDAITVIRTSTTTLVLVPIAKSSCKTKSHS